MDGLGNSLIVPKFEGGGYLTQGVEKEHLGSTFAVITQPSWTPG